MHRDGGNLFDFFAYFARVIAGIFAAAVARRAYSAWGAGSRPGRVWSRLRVTRRHRCLCFFIKKKFFSIILGDQRVLVYRIG